MLHADHLHQFAIVLKSYGTTGEIIISLSPHLSSDIELSEPVFIFFDELPVPFFIRSFNRRGQNRALIRISGIETMDDAEELCGRNIYFRDEPDRSDPDDHDDIVGFTLKDQSGSEIGTILDVTDFSGNICLLVKKAKEEIYIPYHEDLILSIDKKKRVITIAIPEGLL